MSKDRKQIILQSLAKLLEEEMQLKLQQQALQKKVALLKQHFIGIFQVNDQFF